MNISSSFLEELDFEGEVSMEEEPKDVKECVHDLTSLPTELAPTNNENQNYSEKENQILLNILKETENDSDASLIKDKMEDMSGSDAGEIDKETENDSDASLIKSKTGSALGSEAGEIEKVEAIDVEDGEISESVDKQIVCRFFMRGYCYFGPQCQFLHVSDKVYNMFDQPPKKPMQSCSRLSKPPICSNNPSLPIENFSWEKGLENAKAMIKNSIEKRIYDVEFEDKKLYISPESPPSLVYCREKAFSKKQNLSPQVKSVKSEPLKVQMGTQDKKKERRNAMMSKERSHYDFNWVDPWMRSNKKDPISYTSGPKHRKRHCSISSTSSVENIDRSSVYEKLDAERTRKKKRFRKSFSRSYSRSSRSRSSSRSHSSYSESKRSPSYREFKRSKRRSSSLEKWFKKEVSAARRSRSLSSSSVDSLKSYGSSVIVSSLSCSSSDSMSSTNKKEKSIMKTKISPETKLPETPIPQCVEQSSIDHIRTYIRDSKRKLLSQKPVTDPVPGDKAVKLECKPLSKTTKSKDSSNAAFNEISKYQNIKFSVSSAKQLPAVSETLKCKDLDSPSDCKKMSPENPRRNITLNLQPPKAHKKKSNELPSKQPNVSETAKYEKESLSKKESLLKQLKLIEQAIAKKKNLY